MGIFQNLSEPLNKGLKCNLRIWTPNIIGRNPKLTLRVPYTKMYIAITWNNIYMISTRKPLWHHFKKWWGLWGHIHYVEYKFVVLWHVQSHCASFANRRKKQNDVTSRTITLYINCKQKKTWWHIVSVRWRAEHMLLSTTVLGRGGVHTFQNEKDWTRLRFGPRRLGHRLDIQ